MPEVDAHSTSFTVLDQVMMERVERHMKGFSLSEVDKKETPIIRRILDSWRRPSPRISDNSPTSISKSLVTCRLCDKTIYHSILPQHTEYCVKIQEYLISTPLYMECLKELKSIYGDNNNICEIIDFLTEVDIETDPNCADLIMRHLRFLKKSIIMNSDLDTSRLTFIMQEMLAASELYGKLASVMDNSTFDSSNNGSSDSSPRRSLTPTPKMTTLLSSLLRNPFGKRKNDSPISSPKRSPSTRSNKSTLPKISNFEFIKPISRGAYGQVFLVRRKITNDLYAAKIMKKTEVINKNMASYVQTERRIMSLLQTSFVVTLYYALEGADYLFLIMEYMNGGDLSSIIQEKGPLSEDEARYYLAEVVEAVAYLHDVGIIHRDLKPENFLIDAEGHVKLADFGLARYQSQDQEDSSEGEGRILGTPDYLAPEIIKGQVHGREVDWWAVGVCFYEFLTGTPPFNANSPDEVISNILKYEDSLEWSKFSNESISPEAIDLIRKLLITDPSNRIGSTGIKAHPFFASFDWSILRGGPGPLKPSIKDPLDTSRFHARNLRYLEIKLPEDLLATFEDSNEEDICDGASTPTPSSSSCFLRSSSPFDGFQFKNIDQLSKVNRMLSSTPLAPKPSEKQ